MASGSTPSPYAFLEPKKGIANYVNSEIWDQEQSQEPMEYQIELQPENLKRLHILDEGFFGDIYLGLLVKRSTGWEYDKLVAVKTTESISGEQVRRFDDAEREQNVRRETLRDAFNIKSLLPAHLNIIKLIGAITTSNDLFCLVCEYCELGRLDAFLRGKVEKGKFIDEILLKTESHILNSQRTTSTKWKTFTSAVVQLVKNRDNVKEKENVNWAEELSERRYNDLITTSDLLWFALQIARAMSFLAENRVFYKHIALRNMMVKADFNVRVAGLACLSDVNQDVHIENRDTLVPFRYSAPESLRSRRFSMHTGKWSFGVVVWEIFTLAKDRPYGDMSSFQIGIYLNVGKRLPMPEYSPPSVTALMEKLWNDDPLQRPMFQICESVFHKDLLRLNPEVAVKHECHQGKTESQLRAQIVDLWRKVIEAQANLQTVETKTVASAEHKFVPHNYIKKEELGRGGFGVVHKCFDIDAQKFFVTKETHSQSLEHRNTARNEINRLRNVNHPRIIEYYGFKIEGIAIVIFMEYMAAGSLRQVIEKFGLIKEQASIKYIDQILEGLAYIHNIAIVHCDLKCDNILQDGQGNVKLGDFGIAVQKALNAANESFFASAIKGGGCSYWAAPEILNDEGCTRRSDLWSLGCTIVEMLTGRPPYATQPVPLFYAAIVSKTLTYNTNELVPSASDQMKLFLSKLLLYESEERPRTGADTKKIFQQILLTYAPS